jgi:hypothetical protein
MPLDAQRHGNGIGRFPLCGPLGNFLANLNAKPRAADFDAPELRSGHSGLCAVDDLNPEKRKQAANSMFWVGKGGGTRTPDIRIMTQRFLLKNQSCQTRLPRSKS